MRLSADNNNYNGLFDWSDITPLAWLIELTMVVDNEIKRFFIGKLLITRTLLYKYNQPSADSESNT